MGDARSLEQRCLDELAEDHREKTPLEYHMRFRKELMLRSVEKSNFHKACTEWVAAGGVFDGSGMFSDSYYRQHFAHLASVRPANCYHCICTHKIQQQCYIYNKHLNTFTVVGNCCVRNIMKIHKKSCEFCGEGHSRRKTNTCSDCDKCNKKFDFGMYKGTKFRDAYMKNKQYFAWIEKNHVRPENEHLHEFIRRSKMSLQIKTREESMKKHIANSEIQSWFAEFKSVIE